jgi:transposase InsO family protein
MPREKSPGKPTRWYTESEKDHAVRLVRKLRAELGADHGTVQRVAKQLGYGVESVWAWVRERDVADGVAGPDAQRVRELEQRTKQLEQELHETRRATSARAVRDAVMMQVLMVLWIANRKVYGSHKLWKAARRAGHDIGHDQVARLMKIMEIEGISRQRRKVFTTRQDPDAVRAPDLVNRNFGADRPDVMWVTDLTYVPTRTGMAYVCFIVDAFSRRIVGWRVATNMRTDMVLDALEMARRSLAGYGCARGGRGLSGVCALDTAVGDVTGRYSCSALSTTARGSPASAGAFSGTAQTTI